MLAEEKERRQGELKKNIYELSKEMLDEEGIRGVSLKLRDIYEGDFQHSYSGFFPLIVEISKDTNQYNLEYLSNNIESIRSYIEKDYVSGEKEFKSIYKQANKLCEHLSVEIGRWNYYSSNEQKIEDVKSQIGSLNANMSEVTQKVEGVKSQMDSLNANVSEATQKVEGVKSQMDSLNANVSEATQKMENIKFETESLNVDMSKATKNLKKASKKADSIQTELIAVLSVFAAIVVTFSGGFTFLGSVMSSINDVIYYEAVALEAIICGIVIFNTIFLLMYMVGKITNRNIYARCTTEDCSCENKCSGLERIRKRLPYVFYFNIICIVGIIVDCFIWYSDMQGWFNL